MDIKELRIGNWITHTNRNGSYELPVRGIINKGVYLDFVGVEWFVGYEELSGIPLTEEWLLKFGFEKLDNLILPNYSMDINPFKGSNCIKTLNVTVEFGNQYISIREGEKDKPRHEDDLITIRNSDIHGQFFVHQIQNVYYSITGKELEIKETATP